MQVRQLLQADHIWNFLNRGIAISYAIFSSFDEYLDHFDASRDILHSSFLSCTFLSQFHQNVQLSFCQIS